MANPSHASNVSKCKKFHKSNRGFFIESTHQLLLDASLHPLQIHGIDAASMFARAVRYGLISVTSLIWNRTIVFVVHSVLTLVEIWTWMTNFLRTNDCVLKQENRKKRKISAIFHWFFPFGGAYWNTLVNYILKNNEQAILRIHQAKWYAKMRKLKCYDNVIM